MEKNMEDFPKWQPKHLVTGYKRDRAGNGFKEASVLSAMWQIPPSNFLLCNAFPDLPESLIAQCTHIITFIELSSYLSYSIIAFGTPVLPP